MALLLLCCVVFTAVHPFYTFPSACSQELRLLCFLLGTIWEFVAPVVALAEGVQGGEVCFLVSEQERKDVVHHFTEMAVTERRTQRCQNLTSDWSLRLSEKKTKTRVTTALTKIYWFWRAPG